MKVIFFSGAAGGIMPVLAKVSASIIVVGAGAGTIWPDFTDLFVALAIFGFIGGLTAYFLREDEISGQRRQKAERNAFVTGITAPAIIASFISGYTEANAPITGDSEQAADDKKVMGAVSDQIETHPNRLASLIISSAMAQVDTEAALTEPDSPAGELAEPDSPDDEKLSQEKPERIIAVNYVLQEQVKDYMGPVRVFSLSNEGEQFLGSIYPYTINSFPVPDSATGLKFFSSQFESEVLLPEELFARADVDLTLKFKGANDILWALGAKRQYEEAQLEVSFQIASPEKPEAPIADDASPSLVGP